MPRISASQISSQIASVVADELRAASPSDLRISRADQRSLPADVQRAVDDVRATKPGGHVTHDEAHDNFMDRVAASIDAVNQPTGAGRAWLSKAEIVALKQRDPAVGERAQKAYQLLASSAPVATFDPVKWQADLARALTFDFESSFGSEGGQPMSVVRAAGPFTTLDAATFKAAFGLTAHLPEHKIERDVPAAGVLRELTDSVATPIYTAQQETDARTIAALIGTLRDARAFVIGEDGTTTVHPTYIVGLAPDGSLVGLKTGVVWT